MDAPLQVVINAGSGIGSDDKFCATLAGLFNARKVAAQIHLARSGAELASLFADAVARAPRIVVAGGGDGTMSAAAAALSDSGIALGVLPLGTLNHFAKDLQLPLALEAALDNILDGRPSAVDVGEVNGKVFVNNSSLGLYPEIVRERERQQQRLGRGKWQAFARATVGALRRYPFLDVSLRIDGVDHLRRTPFVFIGNNEYRIDGLNLGERSRLDVGCLSVYVARQPARLALLGFAMRALLGRLKQARDFDALLATELVVATGRRQLRVAIDGEVTLLQMPLRYRVRPASLRVIVPRPLAGAAG